MKTTARGILGAAILIWWLPTLVLMLVHIGWLRLAFRVRLGWAKALRLTGNLDAAMRTLDRLETDAAKAAHRSQPSR